MGPAGQALAFRAHVSPVLVIADGGPRPPRVRGIEHAKLTWADMETGQQKALQPRVIHDRTRRDAMRVSKDWLALSDISNPNRYLLTVNVVKELVGAALAQPGPGHPGQIELIAASPI